jgi:hypothetical protein
MTFDYDYEDKIPIEQTPVEPELRNSFEAAVRKEVEGYFQKHLRSGGKENGFNIESTPLGRVAGDTVPGKYGFVREPGSGAWYIWSAEATSDRVPPRLTFNSLAALESAGSAHAEALAAKDMERAVAGVRAALPKFFRGQDMERNIETVRNAIDLFERKIPGFKNRATPDGLEIHLSQNVVRNSYGDTVPNLEGQLARHRAGEAISPEIFGDLVPGLEEQIRAYREDQAVVRLWQKKDAFLLSALRQKIAQG